MASPALTKGPPDPPDRMIRSPFRSLWQRPDHSLGKRSNFYYTGDFTGHPPRPGHTPTALAKGPKARRGSGPSEKELVKSSGPAVDRGSGAVWCQTRWTNAPEPGQGVETGIPATPRSCAPIRPSPAPAASTGWRLCPLTSAALGWSLFTSSVSRLGEPLQ